MQNRIAHLHPKLFFGKLNALSYHIPGQNTACARRGPFTFRLRLDAGERVVAVDGAHAGRFGTVIVSSEDGATLSERCTAPYRVRLDRDDKGSGVVEAVDGEDELVVCLQPHQVRRTPPDSSQRLVHMETLERAVGGDPGEGVGRRAWSVDEPGVGGDPSGVPDEEGVGRRAWSVADVSDPIDEPGDADSEVRLVPASMGLAPAQQYSLEIIDEIVFHVVKEHILEPPVATAAPLPELVDEADEHDDEHDDEADADATATAAADADANGGARARVPESNGAYVYECLMPVDSLMVGRTFDLPIRGVEGVVPLARAQRYIRFTVPADLAVDDDADMKAKSKSRGRQEQPWVLVHAMLKFREPSRVRLEVAFPKLIPAPWTLTKKHWRDVGTEAAGCITQQPDGTLRLISQSPVEKFTTVMSNHVIDGNDHHQFSFVIVRAASDKACGMKLGVCSADGKQQWMLRLTDARLCDSWGSLISPVSAPPLIDQSELPPRYMGCRVELRCNMARRTLQYCVRWKSAVRAATTLDNHPHGGWLTRYGWLGCDCGERPSASGWLMIVCATPPLLYRSCQRTMRWRTWVARFVSQMASTYLRLCAHASTCTTRATPSASPTTRSSLQPQRTCPPPPLARGGPSLPPRAVPCAKRRRGRRR